MKKNKINHFFANLFLLTTLIILFHSGPINCQYLQDRYLSDLFNYEITNSETTFSSNVPEPDAAFSLCGFLSGYILNVNENSIHNKSLKMNIYEPINDGITKRPVIIICFGGGFVGGSKNEASMKWLAEGFSKRGFVTALIDYRLGMKVNDPYLSQRSVYRGIQDGRAAVRYFRADAEGPDLHKIDENQIYVGGHSAGAFIALHNGYLDKYSEFPASVLDMNYPALGDLDEAGLNQSYSGKANAIFSLAGALGDLEWMESLEDLPVILFHDTNDPTVDSDFGMPFITYEAICNINLPMVYGSEQIAQRASALSVPHELYLYNNRGHSVHDSAGIKLYSDIIPKISSFFYTQKLKPNISPLVGKNTFCIDNLIAEYSIADPELTHIQWNINGGTMITNSQNNKIIEVEWDENASDHSLTCIGFNKNGAQSDEVHLDINVIESDTNTFLFNSLDWYSSGNWSKAHVPLTCEDVVIPPSPFPTDLLIPQNKEIVIKSLIIGNRVSMKLPISSTLTITP
jgi:acetyl esterase/lipase